MSDTRNSAPIPILMYHSICVPPQDEVMRSIHVKPRSFANQMWILHKLGYTGLSMTELEPYLRGEKTGKVVGITFDDGYKNNLTQAAPSLARYNFRATCYVVSSAVGRDNFWDRNVGIPSNAIMNEAELRAWSALGLEIGCHTVTHRDITLLDYNEQKHELEKSRLVLEGILDKGVRQFCYPYGRYTEQSTNLLRELGFKTATTMNRGRVMEKESMLTLPRIPITFHTHPHLFIIKLLTKYEDARRNS